MALLTAGYWPAAYNPSNYWIADYWPEYVAGITPTVIGGGYVPSRRKSREKREENEIMLFIKEFLRVQGL